jgi:hypothetical protein
MMTMDNKTFIVTMICGIFASSLLVTLAFAQTTIPTPSIPEFTVSLGDHSYDVPAKTTSTTNPYTGKTITTTTPSYYVRNITIDLTIANQPYPAIINGNESFVYYDVRIKGHFGQDWMELYPYYGNSPIQSNSNYTVVSLPSSYQVGDQIDIQVQAAIGYKIVTLIGHPPMPNVYTESVDFQHASSDWSPTQTFTMPATSAFVSQTPTQSASPSPNLTPRVSPSSSPTQQPTIEPSPTPNTQENFTPILIKAGLVVVIVVVATGAIVYFKKIRK